MKLTREMFDNTIGRLDRVLSEFLTLCEDPEIDEADRQTLKHHADDLIGVGSKALESVGSKYTCSRCGVASPRSRWGPGHVRCPKCGEVERSAGGQTA